MTENEKALQAAIDDMGRAATAAKAKRYAPKPAPAAAEPETPAEQATETPSAEDFEKLLASE